MTRRPAVTLIEVLVSMFIMAIGMLAILVLFPLGALNMGQALKDDRCASTAAMAENVAIAMHVRHDSNVILGFANKGAAVRTLYVDPNGTITLPAPPAPYTRPPFGWPLGGVIPRVTPSFVGSQQLADRWFCLPDDVTFSESGTPDVSSGNVQRGQRYSFAYLLRQQLSSSGQPLIQLYVVVYSGRPIGALTVEQTYTAPTYTVTGTATTNAVTISTTGTGMKRGGWILDGSGDFYRITNLTESGGGTVLEVQPNLIANVSTVIQMDYVAEVIDKGTSWQP